MNRDTNIFNKILANQSNNILKGLYIMIKLNFIKRTQGWFNICKSISVVHHIKRSNDKNHMIISTDAKKAYDKTQHPFMIQTFIKVSIEETSLILTKAIYDKPTTNIIFIVESLSSKFRNKTGCPISPLLFNIVL